MAAPAFGRLLLVGGLVLVGGCATQDTKPLYLWEDFPRLQYDALRREGASPEEQLRLMEEHLEKARASNAALPPGFLAHLGMLQLAAGNVEQARSLWQAEKKTFPESGPYMDKLLRRMEAPAKGDTAPRSNTQGNDRDKSNRSNQGETRKGAPRSNQGESPQAVPRSNQGETPQGATRSNQVEQPPRASESNKSNNEPSK